MRLLGLIGKLFAVCTVLLLFQCSSDFSETQWETVEAIGEPTARHEAGFVAYKDKIYLIGGRRVNPTDEFDTKTNTWTAKSPTHIELHHFQPVVVNEAIEIAKLFCSEHGYKYVNGVLDKVVKAQKQLAS